MLRLTIVVAALVLAKTQVLLGVNNSFDINFYYHFENRGCNSESGWYLVNYDDIGIDPPSVNSEKAIRAAEKSCASSFPIVFFNGRLEFVVYAQVISEGFKISIEVSDDQDTTVSRYLYGKTSEVFVSGWRIIAFNISRQGEGHITMRGRSLKNEIILIDSFRYIPDNTVFGHEETTQYMLDNEEEEEIIFNLNSHYEYTGIESSGEIDDSSGDDVTTEQPFEPIDEPILYPPELNNSFWNPFTISMVAFGALIILSIIAVSAYHCGKVRGMDNTPQMLIDDIEPPRTITIPRITGVHNNRLSFITQS